MKKKILLLGLLILLPFQLAMITYNYSFHGEVLHSSPGMNFASSFNPQPKKLDARMASPKDLVVYEDEIYVIGTKVGTTDDLLLVLDNEYNVVREFDGFELTEDYSNKIKSMVEDTIELIDEYYKKEFESNPVYTGIKLPLTSKDRFIGAADLKWESSDVKTIKNTGETENFKFAPIEVDLKLTVSLWDREEEFTYKVVVNNYEENIDVKSDKDGQYFEVGKDLNPEVIESSLSIDLESEGYETFEAYILDKYHGTVEAGQHTLKLEGYNIIFEYSEDLEFNENVKIRKIVDETEKPKAVHGSLFQNPYKSKGAYGIAVHESGVYIADTGNNRIVKLNHDYEVVDAFYDIDDPTFDNLAFSPRKITVDPSERMYVVANNVYEGILELDTDGSFNRFTGVNPIKLTPFELLKRSLMSEKQLASLQQYLPTEFTNVLLNEKSFLFATAKPRERNAENMIQLINPKGIDVLKRNGYHPPMGDVMYIEGKNNYVIDGPSDFVDIATYKNGIYSVLDRKRSRVFTYDSEGNLLYINGDKGTQSDKFSAGVALDYLGDNLLVLDENGTVIVYQPTEFGDAVNRAIEQHSIGEFEEASKIWEEVLVLNTNYEVAYNGIGKYHLRAGNHKEAMKNFKLGHDKYYYSKAFLNYRNAIIKKYFSLIVVTIILIGVSVPIYKRRHKIFRRKGEGEV